ncbi:unnamed protein product [Moneuplotes crassus]|uniref:Uncharacterized protein n=1 Tax=Euplotes crassus TaxID=5936 RepID=A0AAD1XID7_EUPCR|nr:unnamed protein product [Moneuplotes crassus]
MNFRSLRRFSSKIPAIVTDIDGVMIRGGVQVGNSAKAVTTLKTPLKQLNPTRFGHLSAEKVPFICLTNGGGMMEEKKAESVNNILGLQAPYEFRGEDMVICSTPLKEIAYKYENEYVVVSGFGDVVNVAYNYGFKKALHIHEYSALFPFLSPLTTKYKDQAILDAHLEAMQKRLGSSFDIAEVQKKGVSSIPVKACIAFHDVSEMEESLQIFCDLIVSKDGIPGSKRSMADPQVVDVYTTNPDLLYSAAFSLQRFGQGIFEYCLEDLFNRTYGFAPEIIQYGKPNKNTFQYCQKICEKAASKEGLGISNFYMIGDNPLADIKGANQMGWTSILVKTGNYQPEEGQTNDLENPATHVVDNFSQAIELILEAENIL